MSETFKPKSSFKSIMILFSLLLFSGMGYMGYQFIVEAGRSASGIQNQPEKSNNLDFSTLPNSIPLPANTHFDKNAYENTINNSTGNDLHITAGEFAYRNGQPIIRIIVHNQGNFPITAASVSLSLMLDDATEAAASAVGIPVVLTQPLLPNADVRVDIPVSGEAWQAEQVRMAEKRRIWAQIIAVNGEDDDHTDYPQSGQGVFLKQIGNDWSAPIASDTPLPNNDFASTVISPTPPPDFTDPTAGMNLDIPPPVQPTEWEQPKKYQRPLPDVSLPSSDDSNMTDDNSMDNANHRYTESFTQN